MSLIEHWEQFEEQSSEKADSEVNRAFKQVFFLGAASIFMEMEKISESGYTPKKGAAKVKKLRNEVSEFIKKWEGE